MLWRQLEKKEGAATKEVARSLAREALLKYVQYPSSTPGGSAPSEPSGTSGAAVVTADRDSGVEVLPPEE